MTFLDDPHTDTEGLVELAHRSHQLIAAHQHDGGAYPASPNFAAYRGYAWLRDGAFTAEGVSRFGDVASVGRFHDWAAGVLAARRAQVDELVTAVRQGADPAAERMLPTRFTLDGRDGSDPWWDFQTDGYGSWLWAVVTHARRHGADLRRWQNGMEVAVDYLAAFWDRPCYDWWEEHAEQRHVSTLGAIHGGLVAASGWTGLDGKRRRTAADTATAARRLALSGVTDGHLTKWLGSTAVDASLASCVVPFGLVAPGDPIAEATMTELREQLDVDGGVHRFGADVFYGGGQWLLLSALLGWNLAVAGDLPAAQRYLRWVADHALASGEMPEQVEDHLLYPHFRSEWVDRWGPVATPLLWSHGMYLILADELGLLGGRPK